MRLPALLDRLGRTGLILALIAGCAPGSPARSAQDLPAQVSILAAITPGKPGAPTEEIEVRKKGDEISLRVTRQVTREPSAAESGASLSLDEFRTLWRIVERHDLQTFTPREFEQQTFDFGQRRIRLEWTRPGGTAPVVRDLSWTQEIENDSQSAPLFEYLAALARQHLPDQDLFYFP